MRQLKRAIGYCEDTDCEDFHKGVFLINHGKEYFCAKCRERGRVVPEYSTRKGENPVFKEVQVHFNYDPNESRFRGVAIVRDDSLWGDHFSSYIIYSPLIRTDKRASKVAEQVLANLRRVHEAPVGNVIAARQDVIDLDADMSNLKAQLKAFLERANGGPKPERR